VATLLLLVMLLLSSAVLAGERLAEYLPKAQPADFFAGADRFGEPVGDPPIAPAYRGDELAGYVYLNSDFTASIGYSGKPIHILVGIDRAGVVRGLKLVDHKEPIVLIGIPEARVVASLNTLIGADLGRVSAGLEPPPQVDIVSGATVTVLVMGDSVVRSAVQLIRSHRLDGAAAATTEAVATAARQVDATQTGSRSWDELLGDGSVRRLRLSVGEVSAAFEQAGQTGAAAHPETSDPEDLFIDLYVAPVSVPVIGFSLVGDIGYQRLKDKLQTGQQAIFVAAEGAFSFKGSGYVRGGIFDRIELLQDGEGTRFRDRNHTRLGDLAADGAPKLREIAQFVVPADFAFDVAQPWELQLLVQRRIATTEKVTLPFSLDYTLPQLYLAAADPIAAPPAAPPTIPFGSGCGG
jgi:NosR/NirI family nitrous oxide reductase transcriptional regulator